MAAIHAHLVEQNVSHYPGTVPQGSFSDLDKLNYLLANRAEAAHVIKSGTYLRRGVFSGIQAVSDEELNLLKASDWTRNAFACTEIWQEAKAVGALLGLVIGDALGAPLEFQHLAYPSQNLRFLEATPHLFRQHECYWIAADLQNAGFNRFGLKPGQWTDDSSMALCLADSLIKSVQRGVAFDPLDLRLRFALWWHCGYNNAFYGRPSVGLGGNIAESMAEFLHDPHRPATCAGSTRTSGNGSLMRLAPCAVALWSNREEAMTCAAKQSLTTHQGTEAKELCAVLAHIIVSGIRSQVQPGQTSTVPDPAVEAILGNLERETSSHVREQTVRSLLRGTDPGDWQWKTMKEFRYNEARVREQPGYAGSYSMDAMAMSLHCVWTTTSFQAAVVKAANHCGDADTVAAITGQIAGAIYGVSCMPFSIPQPWKDAVETWSGRDRITAKALFLYNYGHRLINTHDVGSVQAEYDSDVDVGCCGFSRQVKPRAVKRTTTAPSKVPGQSHVHTNRTTLSARGGTQAGKIVAVDGVGQPATEIAQLHGTVGRAGLCEASILTIGKEPPPPAACQWLSA